MQCDSKLSPDFANLSRLQKFAQRLMQNVLLLSGLIQSLNFNLFWPEFPKGAL